MLGSAPVDVALVLAVDCSSSVDAGDYMLQMQGTASALRHFAVLEAIRAGPLKRVAMAVVQWSSRNSQSVAVPWHTISTVTDVETFAQTVERVERKWQPGGTGLANAMIFCVKLVSNLPVVAARKVIDVSGDGADNENGNLGEARQNAIANKITINGLPILYGQKHILDYYAANVICGPGAFAIPANNLQSFPEIMKKKLLRELQAWSV